MSDRQPGTRRIVQARIDEIDEMHLHTSWTSTEGIACSCRLNKRSTESRFDRSFQVKEMVRLEVELSPYGRELAKKVLSINPGTPEQQLQVEMLGAVLLGRAESLRLRGA